MAGEDKRTRMQHSTAVGRIEDLLEEWMCSAEDKIAQGNYAMWGVNNAELDVRDLQVLLAIARAGSGDHRGFVKIAEAAVKGWRDANIRQQGIINRMRGRRQAAIDLVAKMELTAEQKVLLRRALT